MSAPLQKIAEIELAGEKYDLAKNGECCLVRTAGEDAYGRPVAKLVSFPSGAAGDVIVGADLFRDLLNLLGEALSSVRVQREARLGPREET